MLSEVNFLECLSKLGYNSFDEYKTSDLFRIVERTILRRDGKKCRFRHCGKRAEDIKFLAFTVKTLLGLSPQNIVSVCPTCLEKCNHSDFEESQRVTLRLLHNSHMKQGKSNPKIGKWFRDQFNANKDTTLEIYEATKHLHPSYGVNVGIS